MSLDLWCVFLDFWIDRKLYFCLGFCFVPLLTIGVIVYRLTIFVSFNCWIQWPSYKCGLVVWLKLVKKESIMFLYVIKTVNIIWCTLTGIQNSQSNQMQKNMHSLLWSFFSRSHCAAIVFVSAFEWKLHIFVWSKSHSCKPFNGQHDTYYK